MITIYSAKKIITMNPTRPVVSHVAVQDSRILGAGSLNELIGFGEYSLDERFADKVLIPGLIEGHSHAVEGKWWRFVYCGFHDRMDPNGKVWTGLKSVNDVIARMQQTEQTIGDPNQPLTGWAIDPIYYSDKKITRQMLDRISTTRPIGIMHASGHIMSVNSKALELADCLRTGIEHDGVPLGEDGLPTGELRGPDVYSTIGQQAGFDSNMLEFDEPGLIDFSRLCVRTGVTTATDLAAKLDEHNVEIGTRVTGASDFPVRIFSFRFHLGVSPQELIEHVKLLKQQSTDRFRLGKIKVIADGSIQGFTARLNWPGYFNGAPNGLWYIAPEQMLTIFELGLEAGLQIHTASLLTLRSTGAWQN